MTPEQLIALAAFAFVSSITPGPNNLMLMASGANFGFLRTLPHMLGVSLGFAIMLILMGIGLVQIFDAYPVTYRVLMVFSVTYLLYLAWKIATAAAPEHSNQTGKPFTFFQAALFQWVNPKAWAMALTAISVYAPSRALISIVLLAGVFSLVNLPCVSSWAALGQQIRRVLTNPTRLRLFNGTMAALLVGSLYPLLFR